MDCDVDRAKIFYTERAGSNADHEGSDEFRVGLLDRAGTGIVTRAVAESRQHRQDRAAEEH